MNATNKTSQKTQESDIVLGINNLQVTYGKFTAISKVSLQIHRGECFGLMGVNGAGKTSLIKAVLGLKAQESGQIDIFGNHNLDAQSKENIAFMPERFEPPWFLTGEEFIKFSLKLYKRPYNKSRVLAYADQLSLDQSALKNRVHTYSKGMRQKLGILATLLSDCALMIFDEPMSGLDPMVRTQVKDLFRKTHKEGRTLFLSSHILADMEEICDRVSLMHNKTISMIDSPKNILKTTKQPSLERAFLKLIT